MSKLKRLTSIFILTSFMLLPFIECENKIELHCTYLSEYMDVTHNNYVPIFEPVEDEEVEIETGDIFVEEDPIEDEVVEEYYEIDETPLNSWMGVNYYNGFKETYYNLPMQGVCNILDREEIEGYYWVRDDGCKMWGEYIMVGASFELFNRGDIVHTSLGKAMVCDTGTFAIDNPYQFDIATTW